MENENTNPVEKEIQGNEITASSVVVTSLICSLVVVIIAFISFIYLYKPHAELSSAININTTQISELKESIAISRLELESQMKSYIAENYGELSERDEKVDKLLIYFRQQEARLSNIEKALSKF